MSDMKEFFDNYFKDWCSYNGHDQSNLDSFKHTLGLFFWKRGGKRFVLERDDYEPFPKGRSINALTKIANMHDNHSDPKDFLDCVACLGEPKVQELIGAN